MNGRTILVVDDHASVRENLTDILAAEGFQTASAANGLEAVEYLRNNVPDLILCDAVMPGMGGFEFLSVLRSNHATATIPLVFLTGKSEREDFRQGMDLGADDYLTKPWTIEGVLGVIRTRLKRRDELVAEQNDKLRQIGAEVLRSIPGEMLEPLRGIINYSDVLAEHSSTLGKAYVGELSEDIRKSSRRLLRTIENFEFLMRLATAGVTADSSGECGVAAEIVQGAARSVARDKDRAGDLSVETAGPVRLVPIRETEKVVAELADNAFEFSAPGTLVQITVAGAEAGTVITLADCGCGIPERTLSTLLTPGPAGDLAGKIYRGSGLAVCRAVLERLGGTLEIASTQGTGTTVTVRLPLFSGHTGKESGTA